MGLIMKKDDSEDNEYIDGIEVVGRGEGPNGDDEVEHVEIHEGLTAEDISGKTAAAEAERACLQDIQLTVRHAFERDAAISERARAELDMGKVAEFVWTAMLMGIKRDDSSCETLFALVELALY